MIKYFIYIFLYLFLLIDFSYAEIKVIDLSSKNPKANSEIFKEEVNSEIENNLEIKNNEELTNQEAINEIEEDITSIDQNEIDRNLNEVSEVWKNSTQKNVKFLLEKFNHNITSKTITSRLKKFLIYGTQPPKGMKQEDFDKLRISTLESLGDYEAIIPILSSITTYEKNKELYDKIIIKKNLADYNLASVCDTLNNESNFNSDSYILKIKIFCSYLNNNIEEAEFYNTLLLENDNDQFFQALFNKLIGYEEIINEIQEYNYDDNSLSLYSAIMRSIDLPFTRDFIQLNSGQLLKAIAISPTTEIDIRIESAQKAYNLGSLESESIAAIYQSVDFSIEELQNPMKSIKEKYLDNTNLSMALLFQSSRIQILPISRLEALNNFWIYATTINQSKLSYDLSKDLLKSIQPTSELVDFSLATAKAHFYNDNIEESKKWLKLLEVNISTNKDYEINKDYLQIIFLMSLQDDIYSLNENLLNNFIDILKIDENDINNLELYLTTLEYIGFEIPLSLWEMTSSKTKDNRTVPSIYIIKLLEESSSNNLLGELYLNVAISLENNNLSEIHPQHLGIIINSLKSVNEEHVMKELAIEIIKGIN